MLRIYKILFLIAVTVFSCQYGFAQADSLHNPLTTPVQKDTVPTSVNPELENIFNSNVPKPYVISNITVTGSTSFDPGLIISISGLAVGDKVNIPGGESFAKAINNLWKQGLISNAEIYLTSLTGNNIGVEIHITDRPVLTNFRFRGVTKTQQDELLPKMGLAKGKTTRVTESVKVLASDVIRKYFIEKGYRNVTVNVIQTKDTKNDNAVNLVFDVDKKGKVRVNEIYFAGNNSVTNLKLKKQMKGTKEKTRITLFPSDNNNVYAPGQKGGMRFRDYLKDDGPLIPSVTKSFLDPYFRFKLFANSKFNEKKYGEDKGKIIDYYNSIGYRDAAIEADTVYQEKAGLDVAIKLKEGERYYFGNLTWKGNTKYTDSILSVMLGIKKGDIFNSEILNKRLGIIPSQEGGDIQSLYMDDGYLFFKADPVETSVYNDTIDFEIRIQEGPQATIGRVEILGNDKTKEHVIRRELRTIPGEKFSRENIMRSIRELGALGYFDAEKINPVPHPNPENGTVDITWNLVEKSSDQLELSAGFGGGIGLTGTLGVSFNNFSINNIFSKKAWDPLPVGDGQKLSLRGQSNGRQYRSYNFSFTEPWLGGKKRNSFTVSYYNTKYANAFNPLTGWYDKSFADSSFIKITGVSVSLGKQLHWPDDFFALIYQLNYQQYNLKNYNIFPGMSNGVSNNISLKLTLARNSSGPNPIFPTSGSSFMLSTQLTPPYSLFRQTQESLDRYKWVEFHKERFNAEWYVPIGQPRGEEKNKLFVLKASAKFGFLGRYSSSTVLSPFERFQLGDAGMTNTFGFLGYDIIAHRGYPVYDNSDPKVNPDLSQARDFFTIFNKYTLELRYPFSTAASSTIFGLAFFEAANGWYNFKDYNPFRLRRSVGVGMRFFLPMFGLLGFDYGIGLDRINGTNGMKGAAKFTFMLGQEPE